MRTQLDQHKIHRVLHNVSGNFTSILAHRERAGDGKETSVQNFWRYKASTDGNSQYGVTGADALIVG